MQKARLLIIGLFFLLDFFQLHAAPIPSDFKSAVAFVSAISPPENKVDLGTGFFVGVPTAKKNRYYIYFVTAKHVLQYEDKNKKTHWHKLLSIRLNTKDGKTGHVEKSIIASGKSKTIFTHTDPDVDLVVVPMLPDEKKYDYKYVPSSMLITKEKFKRLNIREGTEVFYLGLFLPYPGYEQNHPIVRFGNVALVTDEKIRLKNRTANLYLIECDTFPGNSGSPAFFQLSGKEDTKALRIVPDTYEFAGVVSLFFSDSNMKSTLGIAGIVPAYQLRDILFGQELKKLQPR